MPITKELGPNVYIAEPELDGGTRPKTTTPEPEPSGSGVTDDVGTNANKYIYSASDNEVYYNANKMNKQSYDEANPEGTKTGAGVAAAVGTDMEGKAIQYSWDKNAADKAQIAYAQESLEQKQELLTNRQTLEQNAQQYQTQADMQKYSDAQAADKVGWTGGYVLDQKRQQDYMKASIQAQLYGAMELQKYGYETAMSAARLAYDANMLQYAQDYYNQAVQNALNEAQITGTYFSAETKDMMSQYSIAEEKLRELGLYDEEGNFLEDKYRELTAGDNPNQDAIRAKQVQDTIDRWYDANGISKSGVKTLESWNAEQTIELQWSNELWTRYNAAIQSTKEDVSANNKFYILDENGNNVFDGSTVKIGDWNTMTATEKMDYALNSKDAASQLQSYIEGTIRERINTYKASTYNKETDKYNMSASALNDVIENAISDATIELEQVANNYKDEKQQNDAKNLLKIFDSEYVLKLLREQYPNINPEDIDNDNNTFSDIDFSGTYTQQPMDVEKGYNYVIGKLVSTESSATYDESSAPIKVTDTDETKFGNFNGTGNKNDEQSIWVNCIQKCAAAGLIPEGTVINMNVGLGACNAFMYSNGYWFKLDVKGKIEYLGLGNTRTEEQDNVKKLNIIQVGNSLDDIKEKLKDLTGRDDIVFGYKKYLRSNS